jgi:hypothetical protein
MNIQKIIDNYNKSQTKYEIMSKEDNFFRIKGEFAVLSHDIKMVTIKLINEYDLLYNHKWGFAKSIWGGKYHCNSKGKYCHIDNCEFSFDINCQGAIAEYEYHLMQMVKYTNPWDYLGV